MTTKNDITGDSIKNKPVSSAYRDNWDLIFSKKKLDNDTDDAKIDHPLNNEREKDVN